MVAIKVVLKNYFNVLQGHLFSLDFNMALILYNCKFKKKNSSVVLGCD